MTTETIQYVTDLLVGCVLIVAATLHPCLFTYIVASFGAVLILWAVVGSNVASWIGSNQDIVLHDKPE